MDPIDEIKQLYFKASAQSIERDFARAIDLLKTLPDDEARGRVAVYMEGLAEMRKDWDRRQKGGGGAKAKAGGAKSRGPRGARKAPKAAK